MKTIPIPGGTATFRVKGDVMPGKTVKLIKGATTAAMSQLQDFPELFQAPGKVKDDDGVERDETAEERAAALEPTMKGVRLTVDQAMAWDTMREAVAVATLVSWSLDRRLPTMDTIGDLDQDLYQALLDEAGGFSAADLEASFDPTPKEGDEVPTGNSGSLNMPSATSTGGLDPESQATTPSPATAPTSGDPASPAQ